MSKTTETIKERLSIEEIVGRYITLVKAGANLKARCPFHHEKTPSFFVSPSRGSYYCFGCGAKGDIFTFVEQFEGLDFRGALKELADRAGVLIEQEDPALRNERDELFRIMEVSCCFFERSLSDKALAYLRSRGLLDESIASFRVGYAVEGWNHLRDHLRESGFSDRIMERAGLTKQGERGPYDRFRGRIMFPLFDAGGRVIAFSGRHFEGPETEAKYLNSPETPLFAKSKILYGFDRAKHHIRPLNCSIVVEGQMDLLMAHQAGFKNTVALSGTALTIDQITFLSRLSTNVILAFDGDSAGIASAGKNAKVALAAGMDVKIARVPSGSDPADLIKEDSALFKKAVKNAAHVVEFYLDVIAEKKNDARSYKLAVHKWVLPYVALLQNEIDQAHFAHVVADRLSVPEETVFAEIKKLHAPEEERKEVDRAMSPVFSADRTHALARDLYGRFLWLSKSADVNKSDKKKLSFFEKQLEHAIGKEAYTRLLAELSKNADELLFEAERFYEDKDAVLKELETLLPLVEREVLRRRHEEAVRALRDAESKKDAKAIERALRVCGEVASKLRALNSPL